MKETIEMRYGVSNIGCFHLTLISIGEQRGEVLMIRRRMRQDVTEIEFCK
jgi:hypothetical protein